MDDVPTVYEILKALKFYVLYVYLCSILLMRKLFFKGGANLVCYEFDFVTTLAHCDP